MSKGRKIFYWIVTAWLALGMASTGIVQIMHLKEEVAKTVQVLGYPEYFLTIIGVWKLLGVVAILLPRMALLKEWAYAGFFFVMTGAIISHTASGDGAIEYFGPVLLLTLTILSWSLRPPSRKLNAA